MINLFNDLKKKIKQFRSFFPEKLPTGMSQFEIWFQSFVNTYDLPTVDVASIKYVLASSILSLSSTTAFKSKFYFYLIINAAAAKQLSSVVFQEIKIKQKELEAASSGQK